MLPGGVSGRSPGEVLGRPAVAAWRQGTRPEHPLLQRAALMRHGGSLRSMETQLGDMQWKSMRQMRHTCGDLEPRTETGAADLALLEPAWVWCTVLAHMPMGNV